MKTEAAQLASDIASKGTYLSAAYAVLGWLTSSQSAVLVGILAALGGLAVNWHYKRKADRRLAAEHALRQQERQMRIDIMRATRQLTQGCDSGAVPLEEV